MAFTPLSCGSGAQPGSMQLPAQFPDAYQPIHDLPPVGRKGLYSRQRRRRAEILSAARRQIAGGNLQVNVASLADSCSMAVQTVYNLVGDRHDILAAAVDEHYAALVESALGSSNGSSPIFAIGEALWGAAFLNPDYMRSLSHAFFKQSDVVRQAIEARVRGSLQRAFSLAPDCAANLSSENRNASDRLHVLLAHSAYEWMNERITLEDLRLRVAEDIRIIVDGSLRRQ